MPGEQLLLINPKRRRRRKAHRATSRVRRRRIVRAHRRSRRSVARIVRRRRRNPVMHFGRRTRRRRIHRNPFSVGGMSHAIMPAAIGAVGAVGLDAVFGQLDKFLPASISGNAYLNAAAKAAGAFGLGWAASKVMGREKGKLVTAGALTVIAYQLIRNLVQQMVPTLPLAGYDGLSAYMPSGVGAYMPNMGALPLQYAQPVNLSGLGAMNPSPYLNGFSGTADFGPGVSDSMF